MSDLMQLVRLPAIEPGQVQALMAQIETEAAAIEAALEAQPLAKAAFVRFMDAGRAVIARLADGGARAHELDPAVDGGFRAIHELTRARQSGYAFADRVPLSAEAAEDKARAERVGRIFIGPDLRFTQLVYFDQWRECAMRLGRLDKPLDDGGGETLREAIAALGGGAMLGRLEAAFRAYGVALGILGDNGALEPVYEAFEAEYRYLLMTIPVVFRDAIPAKVRDALLTPLAQTVERRRQARRKAEARRRARAGDGTQVETEAEPSTTA